MESVDNDAVAFLVGPEAKSKFIEDTWENGHKLFKATKERKAALDGVLCFTELCAVLDLHEEQGTSLEFGRDIHAMQYIDGERHDVAGRPFQQLDSGEAATLFASGATFQVHQPQRFNDKLWRICAALEAQLGCLVGCNAYITPPSAQGLAPHYDDVELFVCQTSGKKKWKVYGPLPGQELPPASSSDIPRAALPPPALEVTLAPGDVLYLPRGHVHEAEALATGSSHVTISTYQQWTWKDLLDRVISNLAMAADSGPQLPRSLRAGMPHGFVYTHAVSQQVTVKLQQALEEDSGEGLVAALRTSKSEAAAATLAQALRDAAVVVEATPQVVALEAQAMGAEFMQARLPPHPASLPGSGPLPTLKSRVCCRKSDTFMLVLEEAADAGSESDEDYDVDDLWAGGSELASDEGDSSPSDSDGDGAGAAAGKPGSSGEPVPKQPSARKLKAAAAAAKGLGSAVDQNEEEGDEGGDSSDEDSLEGEEPFCLLLSCLYNDRGTHMIDGGKQEPGMAQGGEIGAEGDEEEGDEAPELVPLDEAPAGKKGKQIESDAKAKKLAFGGGKKGGVLDKDGNEDGGSSDTAGEDMQMPRHLDIPMDQAQAVAAILDCIGGKSVLVSELPLHDDEEKLHLVLALHSWGALRTLPSAAAKRGLGHENRAKSKKKKAKLK